jgi:hypothetical protein
LHRAALIALVVTLLAAVGSVAHGSAATGPINIRIAYSPRQGAAPQVFSLSCNPARGTVANPTSACRRLNAMWPNAFAPTPPGRMCTQIAGGPETALITGLYGGGRTWVRLNQSDGCQIARWNRVRFLFPPT